MELFAVESEKMLVLLAEHGQLRVYYKGRMSRVFDVLRKMLILLASANHNFVAKSEKRVSTTLLQKCCFSIKIIIRSRGCSC